MEVLNTLRSKFIKCPTWLKLVIGALFTALALLISAYTTFASDLKYLIPTGLILMVFFNWVLFRLEGKDLGTLGLHLKWQHLKFLPLGLLLGMIAFGLNYVLSAQLRGDELRFNSNFDFWQFMKYVGFLLPMAASQQFIVRSYCFVKMIEWTNVPIANLVFGILFISMHNIFGGNIFNSIFFGISLFISHLLFSTAFLSFKTLYFAIGIHWGCNVANDHLLVLEQKTTALVYSIAQHVTDGSGPGILGILIYLLVSNIGFILLGLLLWKWQMMRKIVGKTS